MEQELLDIADAMDARGQICYQADALGTAHAIWQAEKMLDGEVIIAFADTLFKADFELDKTKDGAIWVKTVANPSQFGVVTLNENGIIKGMVEKPVDFVSDLAIIGIYYIKNGPSLRAEISHLIGSNLMEKGDLSNLVGYAHSIIDFFCYVGTHVPNIC